MRDNRNNSYNNSYSNNSSDNNSRNNEDNITPTDLISKEQDYRHQWQDKFLRTHNRTFRMGQVFGLIYNSAVLYLVYDLIQNGDKKLAIQIFIANIALLAFAILVTAIERRVISRKPPRRGGRDNKRFNNNRNRNNNNNNRYDQNKRKERD